MVYKLACKKIDNSQASVKFSGPNRVAETENKGIEGINENRGHSHINFYCCIFVGREEFALI